jgi:glycosyltransferase involved in cell wall biosynthesis
MTVGENTGVIVVVAARNEADRIGATLDALRQAFPAASLQVVDDGSRDDTAAIANVAGANVAGATVAGTQVRLGKGGAMTRAIADALAGEQDDDPVVLLCDADLGASAVRLAPLVQAVQGGDADLAIAAFATRAGGGFGIVVRFARWAIARRCDFQAKAPRCGQRALRAHHLRELLPLAPGYGMEIGMTIDALRAGLRVREIELDLSHRETRRTPAGFAHRARQLIDVMRAYAARS